MRYILLITLALACFKLKAQSKKELQLEVQSLNAKVESLGVELEEVTNKLEKSRAKYENYLEEKEKALNKQSELIKENEGLRKRIDSLSLVLKKSGSSFIISPKNQEDSVIRTIQQYYLANTASKRFNFVTDKGKTLSKMEKWFPNGCKIRKIKKEDISLKNNSGSVIIANYIGHSFFLDKSNDGYKLDWESTFGHNDITIAQMKSNFSIGGVNLRAKCVLSEYYFSNYRGKESEYYAIDVYNFSRDQDVSAYVSKKSSLGKQLYQLLSDGKYHNITVKVKIDRTKNKNGDIANITHLISESWKID